MQMPRDTAGGRNNKLSRVSSQEMKGQKVERQVEKTGGVFMCMCFDIGLLEFKLFGYLLELSCWNLMPLFVSSSNIQLKPAAG